MLHLILNSENSTCVTPSLENGLNYSSKVKVIFIECINSWTVIITPVELKNENIIVSRLYSKVKYIKLNIKIFCVRATKNKFGVCLFLKN